MSGGMILQPADSGKADVVLTTKGDLATWDTKRVRKGVSATNYTGLQADSAIADGLTYGATSRSTMTGTGDLVYSSSANTLAQLAGSSGSNGDTLQLAGGVPAWVTVAGGGGKYEQLFQDSATRTTPTQTITATFSPALALANYSNVLCILTAYETSTGTNDLIMTLNGLSGGYYINSLQLDGGSASYRNSANSGSWIFKGGEAVPFWQLFVNIALPHNTYTAMTYQYSGKHNTGGYNQNNVGGGYLESVSSNDIDTIGFEFQGGASARQTELTIYGLAQ